jgi:uncharacterized phage-associated protein
MLLFDINKAQATMLYISNKVEDKNFLKLFKILYFADKKHLAKYGRQVVWDKYIAMSHGPVPSRIYNCFKAIRGDEPKISEYKDFYHSFEVHDRFCVTPLAEPDMDELSKSDIECLDWSIGENENLSFGRLSKKSHDRAWKKASKDDTMDFFEIAKAGKASQELIAFMKSAG